MATPVIYQGDDTDFLGANALSVNLSTDFDLDGCTVELFFSGCRREFSGLTGQSAVLPLAFSAKETGHMPVGTHKAKIRVTDAAGRARTASDDVRIRVTDDLREAYGGEDAQEIDVTVKSRIDPSRLLDGVTLKTNTPNAIRQAVKKIAQAIGAKVSVLAVSVLPVLGASVQTAPLGDLDLDQNPSVVTNVSLDGLALKTDVYTKAETDALADAKISTNNPAFVTAVLDAPLVGADPSDLSELAEYGSYGTVGAALLALIAGLAALKRRMAAAETAVGSKLDEESVYPLWDATSAVYLEGSVVSYHGKLWKAKVDILDLVGPPDGAGSAYWDETTVGALKADADALLDLTPKYPIVSVSPSSGTLTVSPYTVATYTAGASADAFTVAVGTGTTGKARDCILVIDGTATGAVAPTVTWPSNFHPRTDAGTDFACEATRNVYYISEYGTDQFAVGGWQETAGGNA